MKLNSECALICCALTAIFSLPFAQSATAETINVADHGVVPGKDATGALKRLIDSVKDKKDIRLLFPKGQYDFHPQNAAELYRAVANHDNGLKRIGFPLFDCKNISIDGGDSLFMFHGRMVPFTIERAQGITLKNFSIDWIRSFHAELKVVERNEEEKSFVVETDRKLHPYTIADGKILFERFGQQDPIGSNIVYDPKTRAPIFKTRDYRINGKKAKVTETGPNRFRIEKGAKRAPPIDSIVVVNGVHPTSRLCPAIHITNSRDIKIENVTVFEAGGMALIVERTENVFLNGMTVTSTKERFAATRADATHFVGCKGTIRLENCLFEHMLDDGINVHGAYLKIEKYLGDNQFLCAISHFQQTGMIFAEPGDKLALLSRTTLMPFFQTSVTATKVLDERKVIVTVAEMPEKLPEGPLSIENLTWHPDVVMRKNTIRENRARGALITTKGKVLIEDNVFSNQMHGILIEGDNNKWYESGGVNDVTIRNNVFENVGFAGEDAYPLLASPLLTAEQHLGAGYYHRNISFVGNTLKSFNGHMVHAESVQGLTIANNKIEFSEDYPAVTQFPAIKLKYCDKVTVSGNQATGFERKLLLDQSFDATKVEVKNNTGFRLGNDQATKKTTASTKPNIVLMFVDDLGWSDLGYRQRHQRAKRSCRFQTRDRQRAFYQTDQLRNPNASAAIFGNSIIEILCQNHLWTSQLL